MGQNTLDLSVASAAESRRLLLAKNHFARCHSKIWQDLVEYKTGVNKLKPPSGKFTEQDATTISQGL